MSWDFDDDLGGVFAEERDPVATVPDTDGATVPPQDDTEE